MLGACKLNNNSAGEHSLITLHFAVQLAILQNFAPVNDHDYNKYDNQALAYDSSSILYRIEETKQQQPQQQKLPLSQGERQKRRFR